MIADRTALENKPAEDGSVCLISSKKREIQLPGLTFRPLRETARETLAWFESQPAERRAKLRAGLSAERAAQLLAAWKASRRG